MSLTLLGSTDQAALAVAKAAHDVAVQAAADAKVADDKAANARQMVLNRDPVLTSLQDVASKFAAEIARTDQIHADLSAKAQSALDRSMTPGPAGPSGAAGIDGAVGAAGATGAAGARGLTGATGSAGTNGTAGAQGVKGDTGSPGTAGATGPTGLTGAVGATGSTGAQGVAGPAGPAGSTGAAGTNGSNGATGATGPSGSTNLSVGARPVSLLALNASTTVVVPLSHTMPDLTYRVEMAHTSVVTLAAGMLTETARTTTSVTVKVTAVGLAFAAGTLFVVAV